MTTITLDVPEELVPKLKTLNNELPQLLSLAVSLYQTESAISSSLTQSNVFDDVLDFLIGSPSAEQIIAYKVSAEMQRHLEELLDRNREGTLTNPEQAELASYQQINHLLILLKARSRNQSLH